MRYRHTTRKRLAKVVLAALLTSVGSTAFFMPAVADAAELTVTGASFSQSEGLVFTTEGTGTLIRNNNGMYVPSDSSVTILNLNFAQTPGEEGGAAYQLYAGGYSDTSVVQGKTVNVSGLTKGIMVYGGVSNGSGDVTGNTVNMSGGALQYIWGGSSSSGNATGNKVTVSATGENLYHVFGGHSDRGSATGNTVTITGGTVSEVIGGDSQKSATGNTVTISGGSISALVIGGNSQDSANNNTVTISGNTTAAAGNGIYGGFSNDSANGNTVTISGKAVVKNDIFGGYSTGTVYNNEGTPSTADGNTITITGTPDLSNSEVYGGYAYTGASDNTINVLSSVITESLVGGLIRTAGTVAGNTLNVAAKNVTTKYIGGFQNINFYLPKDIAKDDTMLTVNSSSATDVKGVTFGVAALSGVNLQKGDTVNLLVNSNGLTTDDELQTVESSKLAEASFLAPNNLATDKKYELSISKKDDTTIITTVENVEEVTPDPEPKPEPTPTPTPEPKPEPKSGSSDRLKSPVETRMAVATMINAGSDLLAGQGMLNAQAAAGDKEAAGGFNSFAAVGLSKLRAVSGSHVDIKGIGLNLGFARELENSKGKLLFGPIVEYGHGSYDSYLDNGLKADGNASYWGLGLLAKQTNSNGFYYEGSLRAGRTKSDYSSQLSEVSHADYDSSATYWAAHLGAGKLVDIGHDNTMDVYGKYFYSHTGSDSAMIHINGQDDADMHFDSVNSHRLRVGARLIHALNEKNKIYGGLGYQYEFSGDARATYRGDGTPSPGVKGSSGLIELGWQVTPGKGPMAIDFGVTGWVGKQRGVTANLQACWTF